MLIIVQLYAVFVFFLCVNMDVNKIKIFYNRRPWGVWFLGLEVFSLYRCLSFCCVAFVFVTARDGGVKAIPIQNNTPSSVLDLHPIVPLTNGTTKDGRVHFNGGPRWGDSTRDERDGELLTNRMLWNGWVHKRKIVTACPLLEWTILHLTIFIPNISPAYF